MIGYITLYKPDLKFRDYDRYREYYCGLCRTLGHRHRSDARFSLGYDMTFLAILLDSVYDSETRRNPFRCALHPFRKQIGRENQWIDYAADLNLYMTWLKCLDDWRDERKWGRGFYALFLSRRAAAIRRRYPDKTASIQKAMSELQDLERAESQAFEEAAGCFGRVTAEIFRFGGIWEEQLEKIGFYLGKYIYLLDAYEDLEQDLKKKRYNPFRDLSKEESFREMVSEMLLLMISRAAEEFETLPIDQNEELLRNILYAGIWQRFLQIDQKKNESKKDEHDGISSWQEPQSSSGKDG